MSETSIDYTLTRAQWIAVLTPIASLAVSMFHEYVFSFLIGAYLFRVYTISDYLVSSLPYLFLIFPVSLIYAAIGRMEPDETGLAARRRFRRIGVLALFFGIIGIPIFHGWADLSAYVFIGNPALLAVGAASILYSLEISTPARVLGLAVIGGVLGATLSAWFEAEYFSEIKNLSTRVITVGDSKLTGDYFLVRSLGSGAIAVTQGPKYIFIPIAEISSISFD